jgi:tetratricopeptide (TPR) repeat protein
MDFLKRIGIACMLLSSFIIQAQEFDAQLKAFESSYASEAKLSYKDAIQSITGVYRAESYEMNIRLGWLQYKSKHYAESCSYYSKAIQLFPLSVEARLGFANAAAELGNWSQVEEQYVEILKTDPMNSTANYRMGLICYNRQEYDKSIRFLNKTLNQYPFDYDTVILLAWAELRAGKLREAKVMFQKALLNKPGDASALEGLGLIK